MGFSDTLESSSDVALKAITKKQGERFSPIIIPTDDKVENLLWIKPPP